MKEIKCLSQKSNRHHPMALEHRRIEDLESLNDIYFHGLIMVCIALSVTIGVLFAVTTAAGIV